MIDPLINIHYFLGSTKLFIEQMNSWNYSDMKKKSEAIFLITWAEQIILF